MKRSTGRILTTHTGSLPRSDTLAPLLDARSRGAAVDAAAFAAEVETSTRDVIEKQARAGIDVANDGEQSKISFSTYVTLRLRGFGGTGQRRRPKDRSEGAGIGLMSAPRCVGPVAYERLDQVETDCDRFLACAGPDRAGFEELFMTAASPGIIALTILNDYYPSYEEYVLALADEMRKEYELIVSKGLVLQLDCPDLAMERHISHQDEPLRVFQELVRLNVRAINRAITNIPPDSVRLHVCWGNYEGPHNYDVPLADILPLLYEANVGALVLEMANPRHSHEYKVLHSYPLPQRMLLVAGVIDTKTSYVEHPEVVADRIQLAVAATVDPRRVIAGTDCGFSTIGSGPQRIEADVVWQKLRALREGADIASQAIPW